ncbi:LytS/YhcK type 5TM receptor domain-containing protein [Ammoniphilus sp. YIM 78166]|uniref:LytS/YhcK type 5TM receptor domain-containing protein n=1 Tax=Ammoniphilus sp. YIM 78166 TaxID=1644106 RepID=UPI001070175F|nr:LytS/YhcK type 5TM receptor domain-containing protein [Ammoniphilus sp. YIM 78166]
MTGTANLLINISFALLPLLFIFFCSKDFSLQSTKLRLGIVCSISIVLCMLYPFHILPGYILDLRTIPLFIAILYGGYFSGVISTLILYLFRFYLGGEGVWNVLIVYTSIVILLFLLVSHFQVWSKFQKIVSITSIALATSILMVINTNFREGLPLDVFGTICLYILLHGLVSFLSIYTIEKGSGKNTKKPYLTRYKPDYPMPVLEK